MECNKTMLKNITEYTCVIHRMTENVGKRENGWLTAFLARLFSEVICYHLAVIIVRRFCAKTVSFCNISVITKEIYLKLRPCVHYSKSNPYYQGRQFKMHFYELCPFFTLDFSSSIKHHTAQQWHPHVVRLSSFLIMFS